MSRSLRSFTIPRLPSLWDSCSETGVSSSDSLRGFGRHGRIRDGRRQGRQRKRDYRSPGHRPQPRLAGIPSSHLLRIAFASPSHLYRLPMTLSPAGIAQRRSQPNKPPFTFANTRRRKLIDAQEVSPVHHAKRSSLDFFCSIIPFLAPNAFFFAKLACSNQNISSRRRTSSH